MGEITFYGDRILYEDYLKTEEWQKLRKKLLESCNYKCEECGKTNTKLIAHHIEYPEDFMYDCIENLELICDECHKITHNRYEIICPFCKEKVCKNETLNHFVMKHNITDGGMYSYIMKRLGEE